MMSVVLKAILITLFLTACVANSAEEQAEDEACPIYETRDWTASIEPTASGDKPYDLVINGVVDLPNPSYEMAFRTGPMDRRLPPAFTVFLDAKSAGGIGIQVIDPRPVSFQWQTAITTFRSIRVVCGERVLVEFENVEAVD